MRASQRRRGSRESPRVVFRGTILDAKDYRRIRKLINSASRPTRQQIARETCRLFGWRRSNGAAPVRACRELLVRLDRKGLIRLPAPARAAAGAARRETSSASRVFSRLDFESLYGSVRGVAGRVSGDGSLLVRPIVEEERAGFHAAMEHYHYLGDSPLVGESIRYAAWMEGELVAFLGWAGATIYNGPRDRYVGWDNACRRERLQLVVNNWRYLILPWIRRRNLASRVLGGNLRRLSGDWEAVYGHPVLLAETFVDPRRFRGTCYRASNWVYVGQTKGWSRHGGRYEEHGHPKAVYLYPLHRHAVRELRAPLAESGVPREERTMNLDVNKLPLEGAGGLFSVFADVTDSRKRRGLRHRLQSILAVATCAVLAGQRSFVAIEEWAHDQSRETLRKLGCRFGRPPSERTLRRVLKHVVDAEEVDRKLGVWVVKQQPVLQGMGVAIDGKTLRGSRDGEKKGVHLLSAVVHGSGVVVAQTRVPDKSNEIPAVKPLLAELDLEGAVVTADALHTQKETARHLVEDKKADYVLTVKDNQPTMRQDIEDLFEADQRQALEHKAARSLDSEAFPP